MLAKTGFRGLMQVIVATDIFGYTKTIGHLIESLSCTHIQAIILDPYQQEERFFSDKDHAYSSFVEECGHDKYAELVHNTLADIKGPVTVLGFSAGASAAWKAADGYSNSNLVHLIGFYPTQIRHHLDAQIYPPTTLIFPGVESHFDVDDIVSTVSKRDNVLCIQTEYKHGFMNPLSSGYSQTGDEIFCKWLQSTLRGEEFEFPHL
jgi:dienelactone hydrolase